MKKFDVVCIGAMVVDLPLGPISNSIFEKESTLVDEIQFTTGGDALNEAVIISRLGYRAALIGHIGKDMMGDMIIRRCEKDKVDYSGIIKDEKIITRINIVLIKEDGERHFIKNLKSDGGNLKDELIDYEIISNAKAISLASIFASKLSDNRLIQKILKTAKENGAVTFADMVPMTKGETLDFLIDSLPFIDYLMPNLEEGRMLTGKTTPRKIAECLLEKGANNVIIKNGKHGCFIKNNKQQFMVPAFSAKAIDTTGAGDNFAAGFITAFLDGKGLMECGVYANAAAAISTEMKGAVTALKSRQQIEERIKMIE